MIEKNHTFPSGLEAFFLVIALFGLEFVIGAAMYDLRDVLALPRQDVGGMVTFLANGVVFSAVMHYKGMSYRDLFHSSPASATATMVELTPSIAMTIPALVLLTTTLGAFLVHLFPLSASETAMFEEMSSGSFGAIIGACVLAPVLEEMLFRGVILRSFLNQYSRWVAIVGSAALFGLAHMNIYQFAVGMILGIIAGWLYERTRSLLPCIALHAAYNGTLTMIDLSIAKGTADSFSHPTASFYFAAIVLAAAGVVMLRRALVVPAGEGGE
jgi:membrane protease YdiL (CAAX protease family)